MRTTSSAESENVGPAYASRPTCLALPTPQDPDPVAIVAFLDAQFELIAQLTAGVNRPTRKNGLAETPPLSCYNGRRKTGFVPVALTLARCLRLSGASRQIR